MREVKKTMYTRSGGLEEFHKVHQVTVRKVRKYFVCMYVIPIVNAIALH